MHVYVLCQMDHSSPVFPEMLMLMFLCNGLPNQIGSIFVMT